MAAQTLEERVAELEARLQRVERQQETKPAPGVPFGWQRLVGVFQDNPDFEEAVRLGREWRASGDMPEDVPEDMADSEATH